MPPHTIFYLRLFVLFLNRLANAKLLEIKYKTCLKLCIAGVLLDSSIKMENLILILDICIAINYENDFVKKYVW